VTIVTDTREDELVTRLREDSRRVDEAEIALEQARARLAESVRAARSGGLIIADIEKETGYSRGHVYDMLEPPVIPRTAVRRRVRESRRGR
jgi:hypothetical protein